MPRSEELLRSFFRDQRARMLAHDSDSGPRRDPEDLHQVRVAVRRLRSILRTAGPVLDQEWAERLRAELKWLAGETGAARDLDVVLPLLREQAIELEPEDGDALEPLWDKVERARAQAAKRAFAALGSERYGALITALEHDLPSVQNGALERATLKEFERLEKAMKKVALDPTDDAIHRARIKAKRARYATELLEPELGQPGGDLISAAKGFQEVAGEHHDTVVAEETVRSALRSIRSGRTAFGAGLLVAGQRERRRVAASELPDAWKKLEEAREKVWA
jgi:CHAD domain-containing protein